MDIDIEIRGKTFQMNEITNLMIQWDEESKIQHVAITLTNGDTTDFFEEDVPHPFAGELYEIKKLYMKLLPFSD